MVCPHQPYLPRLALYFLWLFPKVKIARKGKHFQLLQDTEAAMAVH